MIRAQLATGVHHPYAWRHLSDCGDTVPSGVTHRACRALVDPPGEKRVACYSVAAPARPKRARADDHSQPVGGRRIIAGHTNKVMVEV